MNIIGPKKFFRISLFLKNCKRLFIGKKFFLYRVLKILILIYQKSIKNFKNNNFLLFDEIIENKRILIWRDIKFIRKIFDGSSL
jgi:hypothetical protein